MKVSCYDEHRYFEMDDKWIITCDCRGTGQFLSLNGHVLIRQLTPPKDRVRSCRVTLHVRLNLLKMKKPFKCVSVC